ncbi:MAG: 5'-nucleotidase [Chlorobi bacterium OLB5]|nr:MAG: 5'-nucleotidase [Chlorobi bacterium OLB5]
MKHINIFLSLIILIVFCTVDVHLSLSQWTQSNNGLGNSIVNSFAIKGNIIFAGAYGSGVFLTTNYGENWTQTTKIENEPLVSSLATNSNNIYAGTLWYGLYLSTDNGANWIQTSFSNASVYALAVNENSIFAANNSVYVSTNNGANWTLRGLTTSQVLSLAVNGNYIFAGTQNSGVFASSNNGMNWSQTSLDNETIYSIAINGSNIYAAAGPHLYLSTNNGINWSQTSLNYQHIISIAVSGTNLFAGSNTFGVYVSSNNGIDWTQRNDGLGNLNIEAFCIINNYIFAATNSHSVYRRPLNELLAIVPLTNVLPVSYSLSQNYPNPFNPVTKIRFDIAGSSVTQTFLTVYDLLGREVSVLVNQNLKPGTFEVDFNASNYPSGVFYYRLTAGDYSETKKMILVK